MTAADARRLVDAAQQAGVVHAVTFNYRGNPLVQQAREMIAGGELGAVHFVHGAYLQDWLLEPTDFSWRLEPDKGGASSAVGDIGSHWCDLVQHVAGQRIVEVLADLTTVIETRLKPASRRPRRSRPAAATRASRSPSPARTWRPSSCGSTAAPRAASRSGRCAPATRTVCGSRSTAGARRCAGCRSGRTSCGLAGARRRTRRCRRIRRCSGRRPAATRTCPAGTRRRGRTRSVNVVRDVYGFIAAGRRPADRAAAGVRHLRRRVSCRLRRRRHPREPPAGRRLDGRVRICGAISAAAAALVTPDPAWRAPPALRSRDADEAWSVYAGVRQARRRRRCSPRCGRSGRCRRSSSAPAAGPGSDHLDVDALLDNKTCAADYRKMIADAGLTISALSCHGNPLHPDRATAHARTTTSSARRSGSPSSWTCRWSSPSPAARAIPTTRSIRTG